MPGPVIPGAEIKTDITGDAHAALPRFGSRSASHSGDSPIIRFYPNDMVIHFRRAAAFVLMLSFRRRILFGAIALDAAVGFISWVLGVIQPPILR
jgi:hypothetical protein